jgi:hypothetical protein
MSDESKPFDISQCDNPAIRGTYRFFCRHLVCLGGWVQPLDDQGKPQGEPEAFAFSACVLVIQGAWFLLTAGHILKRLDERLANKEIKLLKSYLLTGFGPEVTTHNVATAPIDFDYERIQKSYIDQDGLDFGLLDLGTYLRAHLEKNEVEPIREENWRIRLDRPFDYYVMLGFPQEFVDQGLLRPTMLYVQKVNELPEDIEQTDWPRFIGKFGDKFRLKSLVGMSGGPIYGFSHNDPNRYWIPAIQSSWRRGYKITFGCPVPLLAHLAETCLFADQENDA